jgi:hypothetical protein
MPDRLASARSLYMTVMAFLITAFSEPTNSKAVGGYAANGFALSPIRAVFSDSIGRVS